ncbi:hypothetical protein FRC03_003349 [Tulasnella sp. 419]|nr:hypothetical protein FRC03_003349 [Tulasnella sp. 419]
MMDVENLQPPPERESFWERMFSLLPHISHTLYNQFMPMFSEPYIYEEEIDNDQLRFPHVFIDHVDEWHFDENLGVLDHAWTIPEQRMFRLSASLRSKPEWWTKYMDPVIRTKWRSEALEQKVLDGYLTEQEVDYVLDELQGYDRLRTEETGAQVSCFDRIWQSDSLVSDELREDLITEIAKLEDVPEDKKDWHPRSDGLVLDLVHPSLYCMVYGRTRDGDEVSRSPSDQQVATSHPPSCTPRRRRSIDPYAVSERFAWIPTDFDIAEGGANAMARSYINNLHPQHDGLYRALQELVARFSHLFDHVLTDLHPQNELRRRITESYDFKEPSPERQNFRTVDAWLEASSRWEDTRTIVLPTVPEAGYEGGLEERAVRYTIQGTTVQIIVKLANIHLTPDKPEYGGGSWHIEGMANERIVASGIYYFSTENVTPSQLAFRESVKVEDPYEQDDHIGINATWGLQRDKPRVQDLGAVDTLEGRCIVFPNIYQHRVSSFKLVDPTKPGHRKIIALFLVDPLNRIPSTSSIPPQQEEWIKMAQKNISTLGKLPSEMLDIISRRVDITMSEKEAKQYREELMDERTRFIKENDKKFFEVGFNMCEH